MKKTFYTKDGEVTRDLTSEEELYFESMGDTEVKKDKLKKDLDKTSTDSEKIDAIIKYLGVN